MVEKRFIVVTDNETRFNELSESLKGVGTSVWLHWNTDLLGQLVGSLGTDIVFIDYIGDNLEKATELTRSLLAVYPSLWVVGFSHRSDSPLILEAMRAGATRGDLARSRRLSPSGLRMTSKRHRPPIRPATARKPFMADAITTADNIMEALQRVYAELQ